MKCLASTVVIQWLFCLSGGLVLGHAWTETAYHRFGDLLNMESTHVSNTFIQDLHDVDEVRIIEVPESPPYMMGPNGKPHRVRTFAGMVFRKRGKKLNGVRPAQAATTTHFSASRPEPFVQMSQREPFVTTNSKEQMMLVNLGAILGQPSLGIAEVPLKILTNTKYEGRRWIAVPTRGIIHNNGGNPLPSSTRLNAISKNPPLPAPNSTASKPLPVLQKIPPAPLNQTRPADNSSSIANATRASIPVATQMPSPHSTIGHAMPQRNPIKRPLVYYYQPSRYSSPTVGAPPPNRAHRLGAPSQPIPAIVPPEHFRPPSLLSSPPTVVKQSSMTSHSGPLPSNSNQMPLPAKVPLNPSPWRPLGKPLDTEDFMQMPTLTAQPVRRTPKMMIRRLFGGTQDNIVISVDGNEHLFQDEPNLAPSPSIVNPVLSMVPSTTTEKPVSRTAAFAREFIRAAAGGSSHKYLYHAYFG